MPAGQASSEAAAHGEPPKQSLGTKGVPRGEREAQILDLACREFAASGYAATQISVIAKQAGISKPLIYQYFESKTGLYTACVSHAVEVIESEIDRVANLGFVGLERGLRTMQGLLDTLDGRRHLWSLLTDPSAPPSGEAADLREAHAAHHRRLALEGVGALLAASGDRDPDDVSALSAAWIGIVDSLITWWIDHPDQDAAAMSDRITRLLALLFAGTTDGDPSAT